MPNDRYRAIYGGYDEPDLIEDSGDMRKYRANSQPKPNTLGIDDAATRLNEQDRIIAALRAELVEWLDTDGGATWSSEAEKQGHVDAIIEQARSGK